MIKNTVVLLVTVMAFLVVQLEVAASPAVLSEIILNKAPNNSFEIILKTDKNTPIKLKSINNSSLEIFMDGIRLSPSFKADYDLPEVDYLVLNPVKGNKIEIALKAKNISKSIIKLNGKQVLTTNVQKNNLAGFFISIILLSVFIYKNNKLSKLCRNFYNIKNYSNPVIPKIDPKTNMTDIKSRIKKYKDENYLDARTRIKTMPASEITINQVKNLQKAKQKVAL